MFSFTTVLTTGGFVLEKL